MQALMNSYVSDLPAMSTYVERTAGLKLQVDEKSTSQGSILFVNLYGRNSGSNARIFKLLEQLCELREHWDDEFGLVPDEDAIRKAKAIVQYLSFSAQKVYHTAPGPNGEVMIDIRNRDQSKSLEIIFYPNISKYVKFTNGLKPQQGMFDESELEQLIDWVNAI